MFGDVCSMSRYHKVVLIVTLHAVIVGMAVFVGFFYFAPDKIVFGVQASLVLSLLLSSYNFVAPNLSRLFGWRDIYLGFIVRQTQPILWVSCALGVLATCWVAFMLGTIVERYKYLDAVDHAISVIGSNQLALPAPEDLAAAFDLMPERPEVPFILMRAARLLSFDDRPQNYYAYVQKFMEKIDKDAIAARFSKFSRPAKFSIDGELPALPLLDPIQILSNFVIESENPFFRVEMGRRCTKKISGYRRVRRVEIMENDP